MTEPVICFRDRFPPHGKRVETFAAALSYSFQLMRTGRASFTLPLTGPDSPLPSGAPYMSKGAMVTIERGDGYLPWVGFVTRIEIDKANNTVDFLAKDHAGALFARAATLRGSEQYGSAADLFAAVFREANMRAAPPLLCELALQNGGSSVAWTPQNGSLLQALGQLASAAGWEWALRYTVGTTVRSQLAFEERIGSDVSGSICYEDGMHLEAMRYSQDIEGDVEATIAVGGAGAYEDRLAVLTSRTGAGGAGATETRTFGMGAKVMGLSSGLGGTVVLVEPQVKGAEALAAAGSYAIERPKDALGDQLSFTLIESEIDMSMLNLGNWCTVISPDIALGQPLSRLVRIMALQLGSTGKVETEVQVVA